MALPPRPFDLGSVQASAGPRILLAYSSLPNPESNMPSFDIVSKPDWVEIGNALDQARREISQRFDFKKTDADFERNDRVITISANADDRVNAALDVFKEKLIRRKVSLRFLEIGDLVPSRMGKARRLVTVKEGIGQEDAKALLKLIKSEKMKVQASIQEDTVRISAKKRDDLQATIQALKATELVKLELQFVNFRD